VALEKYTPYLYNETGEKRKRRFSCDSLYVTNFNEWGRVVSWGLIGHLETEARQETLTYKRKLFIIERK